MTLTSCRVKEPEKITLKQWDRLHAQMRSSGVREPCYGGPLGRHAADGDLRLNELLFDNSEASLMLWNFLLTEEDRLNSARKQGKLIIGAMKDLGTVPVMAYSLENLVAFYPDGAWWTPCIMKSRSRLLEIADALGVNESFCPVRAMLGAFVNKKHFPVPDLLVCSVGATCDDFSAIAQRVEGLGYGITWWEIPHRRHPDPGEPFVVLPGGFRAPKTQVDFVEQELERIKRSIASLADQHLDSRKLRSSIRQANRIRNCLAELRRLVFTADPPPLPALEMLIAEMLAIHYCSDRTETMRVLDALLTEVRRRVKAKLGYTQKSPVKIFWVNPVADLRAMNLLEDCGGRICGTDYLFMHALDEIPTDVPPMRALAMTALADPMVGSARDRAARICADMRRFGAEAAVISRIPGASHCALESIVIADIIRSELAVPVAEIEVPPVLDSLRPALSSRLTALVESAGRRRRK